MPRGAELPDDEGQCVLGRVLQDPRVAPAVLTALPARAQAGLAVADAVADTLVRTNKRSRTECERVMSGTVSAACFHEGDTPRIVVSAFSKAWTDPRRGSLPVSWAIDPQLGEEFPALFDYFSSTAGVNDSFISGPGGCGCEFMKAGNCGVHYCHRPQYRQRLVSTWSAVLLRVDGLRVLSSYPTRAKPLLPSLLL